MMFDSPRSDLDSPQHPGGSSSSGSFSRFASANPGARAAFPKQLSDKYRLGEELGRGAYGRVFRGLDTRTGELVAIKQLSLDRISAGAMAGIMTEVDLLKALNHRNVVQYLGSYRTRTHLYIIMELVENGSLAAVIKGSNFGPFPESLVAVYIQQVLTGLVYLHDQGVVHRDIKGANILTTKEGLVKLADFGVAARLGDAECDEEESQPAGTPYWMAPEVVELKTVTTASDIWSVGCLAVELLTGQPPYYDLQPLSALYNIVQDEHPPLPPTASPAMQEFLLQCFNKDPARRPSAKDLLQNEWINYNRRALRSTWGRTRSLKTKSPGDVGAAPAAHATVASVVERILSVEARASMDSEEGASPKHVVSSVMNGADALDRASSDASGATHFLLSSGAEDVAQQEEFLRRLDEDASGACLLKCFQDLRIGYADAPPRATPRLRPEGGAAQAAMPQDEAEVRRQIASLRIMASPGERSLVEEAAAAASARALVGYLAGNPSLRATFVAGDGLSGLRELLDSSSERVLAPTLDLLLALTSEDQETLEAACALGLIPAALRFTGSQHDSELRLAAANFACLLTRASATTAHMLVACQGVPFFMSLMDDAPQTPEQFELLAAAAAGFWAILYRTVMPGWPLRTNQYLRLMAHHGLPQRIIRVLPWAIKNASAAAATTTRPGQHDVSGADVSRTSPPTSVRGMRSGNRVVPEDALGQKGAAAGAGAVGGILRNGSLPSRADGPGLMLVETLVNLFAAMTHGDAVVKTRCSQLDSINAMFGLTVRMSPPLQLQVLRAVRRLSAEQSVLGTLEAANVVAYVAAQLPREDTPALQAEALCTLHNLCQLSRSRQEKAAEAGVVPWLCRLVTHPPLEGTSGAAATARSSCIAVLCALAHCSPKTRAEMWSHGALDIMLQLLKEEPHQAAVLEGLASWLDAELPRIEGRLLEDTSLARLVLLLPTSADGGSTDQLPNILSPLGRMLGRSRRLAVALASSGLAARATDLVKRPSPPTALALMELLRLMYEAHPSPKEFIAQNRVGPALAALAAGAQAGDQVLVCKQANSLLKAFTVNAVF